MKKLFLLFSYFSVTPYIASAQNTLPDTDIFICDVELKNGKYSFTNLKNITNREGYDNQPNFIDNNTILYTSMREDKQADIYKYDLMTGSITQVTNTPEDEYSPTLMPDEKHISTVRVEKDSAQRLWKFPLAHPNDFSLVFPKIKNVGNYAWMNDSIAALFIVSKPLSIYISDIYKSSIRKIDHYVGQSVQPLDEFRLAYINKNDSSFKGIWIANKTLNSRAYHLSFKIQLPKGTEEFIYGSDCVFWIIDGTKLMRYDPLTDTSWKLTHDFYGSAVENFYRIAFSPDGTKFALVKHTGRKPKFSIKHSTW